MSYVWRYNPDSTSRRAVRVRSDSPEASEWPSRAPSGLSSPRVQRKLEQAGERVGRVAIPAAISRVAAGVRRVVPLAKTAAVGAGQAAIVAAVGAGAYLGASYIREQIVNGATDPEFIVSMAALRARREVQHKIGRALTATELHQLRDELARRFAMMEATMKIAAPFGLGQLVNLLRRAI